MPLPCYLHVGSYMIMLPFNAQLCYGAFASTTQGKKKLPCNDEL